MNSKFQIILGGHVDRDTLEAVIPMPGIYIIDVVNNYYPEGDAIVTLDAGTLDGTYLEALKKVIDAATFLLEENAYVWKITLKDNILALDESYKRNVLSTDTKPDIPNGTPISVRFEVPAFEASEYRDITLWYNQAFDPSDLALLEEIGITLTGNGAEALVNNTRECKVSFSRPGSATDPYIIDFDSVNVVAPPYIP